MSERKRKILVVSHTARADAITATQTVVERLQAETVLPVMHPDDIAAFKPHLPGFNCGVLGVDAQLAEIEIALVLGGDGTILRAAELVHGTDCPVLGINLGHVGFLAEMEKHDLETALARVLARDYVQAQRGTLNVRVYNGQQQLIHETFALNEATVEKSQRMIEIALAIDGRRLSVFGCDGVVMATATGSTAYAFSAGGPIIWPEVEATLVVPLAAHALFNRPLVLGPKQQVEAQLAPNGDSEAVLWCDGRRTVEIAPGSRVVVQQNEKALKLARLNETAFTERLVNKFALPTDSWRGHSNTRNKPGDWPAEIEDTGV